MSILISFLLISLFINVVMFLFAYFLKTDKLTDLSYGGTFIILTFIAYSVADFTSVKLVLALMIIIWAVRLIAYLFTRINKIGKDERFDEMRSKFFSFLKFWILQGFAVWVIMIPTIFYLTGVNREWSILSTLGVVIWSTGLVFETIADFEKSKFKNNPKNKNKWIDEGTWSLTRHPNYFGEILVWIGVFVFTFIPSTIGLLGIVSPLFIIFLLVFVSGIPLLEKAADKKWGKDKKYIAYKKRTSILIPWFPRK